MQSSSQRSPARAFDSLPLQTSLSMQPWQDIIAAVQAAGADLMSCAWLLPRLEQAGPLRAALAAARGSRQFFRSPVILSADRLSDSANSVEWTGLRLLVHKTLAHAPVLVRQARSVAERWQLADEYLRLALACVAGDAGSSLEHLDEAHALAGPEASIVLAIADTFRDSLVALLPAQPDHPGWASCRTLVWLDDGEPAARQWLQLQAGDRQVLRCDLLSQPALLAWAGSPDPGRIETGEKRATSSASMELPSTSMPRLLEAPGADAAAHLAARQILDWLAGDASAPVGVAVVDRLLARRLRSELERCNVRVDDRTGWRLSTTRMAGWLNLLMRGWLQCDWSAWVSALEPRWVPLLASPGFAQLTLRWVECLHDPRADVGWDELRSLALMHSGASADASLQQSLSTVLDAFEAFGRQERPLSQWALDLLTLLNALRCLNALQSDAAGEGLLAILRALARAALDQPADSAEWLLVLGTELESARFRPEDISSPVRMMPLQSFRLQRFPRMLVLGCARRHFMPSPPGLLPPSVASELNVADPWLPREQALAALAEILAVTPDCALVHQSQSGGRPDPVLGWLHALGLQGQAMGLPDWRVRADTVTRRVERSGTQALPVGGLPQPAQLSVQAVSELAACPLQFVLGHLTGLKDAWPGKPVRPLHAVRGTWLHDLMECLWRDILPAESPAPALDEPAAWLPPLRQAMRMAWQRLNKPLQLALYQERLELERNLPALAKVLAARHADGWRTVTQEKPVSRPLQFDPQYPPVNLRGRIDRIERRGEQSSLVDIKSGNATTLKKRATQWADFPQLPLYAWMLENACDSLEYLAVRGDEPDYVPLKGGTPADMADTVVDHLVQALQHLFVAGAQVSARPGDACAYCEHEGVCRSAWWSGQSARLPGEGQDGH